jgi:microcystin-dependent protein
MSYRRAQRRELNQRVMLDNRLSTLTNAHNYLGDLHIERNATIGGNLDVSGDLHARSYYATGNYYLDNYVLIPAGTIIQSAAINEPEGWFDCNGRTLLVAQYAYLFSAIGYAYSRNVYSGSDLSFNIPDMRGRVGIGYGTGSGLTARSLGDISGAETHTLTVDQMPAHDHGGSTGSTNAALIGSTTTASIAGHEVADNGSHSHTIPSQGGGSAHNNMQPYVVLRYLIKY